MGKNNFLKVAAFIGFVVLAGYSCYLTSRSFVLMQPNRESHYLFIWFVIAIALFVVASMGTKKVVDSLDTSNSVMHDRRGKMLATGIVMVLVFWIMVSLPTNTHTLIYESEITSRVKSDLKETQGYLERLTMDDFVSRDVKTKIDKVKDDVTAKLISLESEIDNPNNIGDGDNAKKILGEIAGVLGCEAFPPLSGVASTAKQRRERKDAYRNMVMAAFESYVAGIAHSFMDEKLRKQAKADAKGLLPNIKGLFKDVEHMEMEGRIDDDLLKRADQEVFKGYGVIRKYMDYLDIPGDAKIRYSAEEPLTRYAELTSIKRVWGDIFGGRFSGKDFLYCLMIALLIDVAAFLFFDIAFKKSSFSA